LTSHEPRFTLFEDDRRAEWLQRGSLSRRSQKAKSYYFKSFGENYQVGLINIHPGGIEKIQIQQVLFEGQKTPIVQDQLYYLKWVDTETGPGTKGYTLVFSRKEGEDIYYDAEFRTKGFTLKAPKIQVKDLPARVKVTVLSKIK